MTDREQIAPAAWLYSLADQHIPYRYRRPAEGWTETPLYTAEQMAAAETKLMAEVVAWLKKENGLCDCFARSEGECGCGAWDGYKTWPLERVWDTLETGAWRQS